MRTRKVIKTNIHTVECNTPLSGLVRARIMLVALLSLCFLSVFTPKSFGKAQTEMYEKGMKLSNKELKQRSNRYIYNKVNIDSALVYLSVVANRFYTDNQTSEDVKYSLGAMNDLGYIYFYFYYDYQKSYNYLSRALAESKKINDVEGMAYINLNLGNLYVTIFSIYNSPSMTTEALNTYKEAFRCALESKNWHTMQIIFSNMYNLAADIKKFDLIAEEINTYKKLKFDDDIPMVSYNRLMLKGFEALNRKDYKAALACFEPMAQSANSKLTPERDIVSALGQQAHIYSLMGNNDMAISKLYEARAIIVAHNLKDYKVGCDKELYGYYESIGKKDSAAKYRMEYLQARDSVVMLGKLHSVEELYFQNNLQNMNEEVRVMAQQRKLQSVITVLVALIAFVVIVFLVVIIKKNRQLKANHKKLFLQMEEVLRNDELIRQNRKEMQGRIRELETQIEETQQPKQKAQKYQNSNLDDDEKKDIYSKVCAVMEDSSAICKEGFTLKTLAEITGISYVRISQVINETAGKNFNTLLNEYRIKEACRRLVDYDNYGNLTIEGIAVSIGFKSRTNFVATFKRITGLTPLEYQKLSKEQNNR